MTKEVPEHIQRHRVGRASAALPEWAAVKFTDAQAAAMRPVGIEMLNKRGVCALHLKIIADAAGVGIGAAREAITIAETIGLITIERHFRGLYNMRSRWIRWPPLHSLRARKPPQRAPQQLRRLPGQGPMRSSPPSRPCPSSSSGWRWGKPDAKAMPGPSGASYRRPTKRRSETG